MIQKKIVLLILVNLSMLLPVMADDFSTMVDDLGSKDLTCEINLTVQQREYEYLPDGEGYRIDEVKRDEKTNEIRNIGLVLIYLGKQYQPSFFTKVPDEQLIHVLKELRKKECPPEEKNRKDII